MNKQWTPDPNATYVTLFDNPADPNSKKPERTGTIKFPADCSHLAGHPCAKHSATPFRLNNSVINSGKISRAISMLCSKCQ